MNLRLRNGLILLDACIMIGLFWIIWFAYFDHPKAGPKQTVQITSGASVEQVANLLASQGIITSSRVYRIFSWVSSSAKRPRAGTYAIQPGKSYNDIARLLARGPEQHESQLRVIEGWTLNDVSALLMAEGVSSTTITTNIGKQANQGAFAQDWRTDFSFLRDLPLTRSLEGYLFPDTYRVWEAQLPEGLIRKQLAEFQTRYGATTISSSDLRPLTSLDDVVILASIVEKEVRTPEDRRRVAGIFLRRLRLGMPLQSDATLTYVTGSKRDRATAAELTLDSPYNSYRFKGLPPSPICNPGATALDAVLNPILGRDLYFLTDQEGKVYYAATLDEHVRNKRRVGI